ncbi:MAG TPA: HAMP domain-containing sensor histidine kinase, partial [Longimicrobiales bacterium]|nr:HAMP domain-containing sensor histidine kinase [Longimicrobiales bacterium]
MQDQLRATSLASSSDDRIAASADEIVDGWLASLPYTGDARERARAVLRSYRTLGLGVLQYALSDGSGAVDVDDEMPRLDRTLWGVAAANRRAGLEISQTLDDVLQLQAAALRWLWSEAQATESWADMLRRTTRLGLMLGGVTSRLVHILEESAMRSRREHSAALAAMTEMLSHELGNRLGAALTAAEMLVNPEIDLDENGLARAASIVRASVDAALHTVEDVRALATSRSRLDGPHHPRSIRLPSLVNAVVERLRSDAEDAKVEMAIDGDIAACRVDAARTRLIVFNLVGNGIKYHDPKKQRRTVRLSSVRRDDRLELRVSDNGIGIPEDELADIFGYRRRGSEANSVPGSGLGLAIVREA